MSLFRFLAISFGFYLAGFAHADESVVAKYLANAGVLISHGETKIVFDPLFDEDFGTYELVPEDIQNALFAGTPPFDGLDAIFVSHHHGDHFSPERMVQLMRAHPDLLLFGPRQAIDSMPVDVTDTALTSRLRAVELDLGDDFSMDFGDIEVNAVRIPHAGWPTRHADVENILFRVSLDKTATVLHMGDAHTDPTFFDQQSEYWAQKDLLLALPPYWFFLSDGGMKVLADHIHADETIGVHVPREVPDRPDDYPSELQGREMFTRPGESHTIEIHSDESKPDEVHPSEN